MRHAAMFGSWRLATALAAALLAPATGAQSPWIVVTRNAYADPITYVRGFDRRLHEGLTFAAEAMQPASAAWSPALGQRLALNKGFGGAMFLLGADASWTAQTDLPAAALELAATRDGRLVLASHSTVASVGADGAVQWSVNGLHAPDQHLAIDANGQAWLGRGAQGLADAVVWRLDTQNGAVLEVMTLGVVSWFYWWAILDVKAMPDGSVWVVQATPGVEPYLYVGATLKRLLPGAVLQEVPLGISGIQSPYNHAIEIDASGRHLLVDMPYAWCCQPEKKVIACDPDTPAIDELLQDFGKDVQGIRLGPTGRELFAILEEPVTPTVWRLARLNLQTGARSTVPLGGAGEGYATWAFPSGDTTGWAWAFAVDAPGDADADGASNGAEATAGSNPYDPTSRPDGPQVSVWFPSVDSVSVTLRDPDGVDHPTKGLNLRTFELVAKDTEDALPMLRHYFAGTERSADGTSITFSFSGFPSVEGTKVRLEARIADWTGARDDDWQVTPPGDL